MTAFIKEKYSSFYSFVDKQLRSNSTLTWSHPKDPLPRAAVINFIERMLGMTKFSRLYDKIIWEITENGRQPWDAALHTAEITLIYDKKQLEKIPTDKPIIFVANHPFGVTDGAVLSHLGQKVRGEVRIFINDAFALCEDPYFGGDILPIAVENSPDGIKQNLESRNLALDHLKAGGALVVFPSAAIATAPNVFDRAIEKPWKITTAKIIKRSKATVIPIYFHGQNSWIFQLANKLGRAIRYATIVYEALRSDGTDIHLEIGDPIPYEELASVKSNTAITAHIRQKVLSLGGIIETSPPETTA